MSQDCCDRPGRTNTAQSVLGPVQARHPSVQPREAPLHSASDHGIANLGHQSQTLRLGPSRPRTCGRSLRRVDPRDFEARTAGFPFGGPKLPAVGVDNFPHDREPEASAIR